MIDHSPPVLNFTNLDNYITVLVWSNELQFYFFQLASLISNICLCHDLIATLKSPFNVADQRMKKYIFVTIGAPFIIVLSIVAFNDQQLPTEIVDLIDYYNPCPK